MKKKTLFALLTTATVLLSVGCSSNSQGNASQTDTKQETKQEDKKITLADYNSIVTGDSLTGEGGMTYEEVVTKFGEPSTKSESQSGNMKMIMAIWTKNVQGDIGANFSVTFVNDKASGKSQMGLK